MDIDRIDGAACAATDLTARLQAELAQAQALLAVADARAFACLAQGAPIPADARAERLLHKEKVAVLREVLDGVPAVEGGCRVASA